MTALKKFAFLVILFFAIEPLSFGQKQNTDSLTTVIKAISNSNIYEVSYTVGYAGTISKQYQRFEKLLSLATGEQLIDLAANNNNAVVRLYAFQALKRKKIHIPDSLIEQFQNDHTIVNMLKGCIGDKKSVNLLAQEELTTPYNLSN